MTRDEWKKWVAEITADSADEVGQLHEAGGLDTTLDRSQLAASHGQVWNSFELARDFDVRAWSSPHVLVVRKADGAEGRMTYQHNPRFYWGFDPAK